MSDEGPARPANLTRQIVAEVHQVVDVLNNPSVPVAASADANTVTVSSPRNSAAPVVQSSSTLTPSTSTSVLSTPIPSSGSSQGGLEVGRFEIFVQEYFFRLTNRLLFGWERHLH